MNKVTFSHLFFLLLGINIKLLINFRGLIGCVMLCLQNTVVLLCHILNRIEIQFGHLSSEQKLRKVCVHKLSKCLVEWINHRYV